MFGFAEQTFSSSSTRRSRHEIARLWTTMRVVTSFLWYSEFDKKDEISPYSSFPVLYPQRDHSTPTLKLFRREPAITEFDKLFTPYHKSSDGFVRPTGSGLHDLLQSLHPAHGKLIPLRVVPLPLFGRAIHARFHCASVGLPLRQGQRYTRRLILQ